MTRYWKNWQLKKINFFWLNNCNLPSLGIQEGRPSYRRSLQPSKRTSSTSKHEIFKFSFTFEGQFCLPGSGSLDPDSKYGSGFTDLKHCEEVTSNRMEQENRIFCQSDVQGFHLRGVAPSTSSIWMWMSAPRSRLIWRSWSRQRLLG